MLPSLKTFIAQQLNDEITGFYPVTGGNINRVYRLQTANASYLLKTNNKKWFPNMFKCEATALKIIADTNTVATPTVIAEGEFEENSFLLLEWINATGQPSEPGIATLGHLLAKLHRYTAPMFGLEQDNYMGSLRQLNTRHQNWGDFFIVQRLQPMVKMATDLNFLNKKDSANFERLYKNIPNLYDVESPSLIHGDLWAGNYLINNNDKPYLIDPAISYSHRECDIAMTTLFGGFSKQFYLAYNESFPLSKGWQHRLDLWNLYPLLVHLNLFGVSYLEQIRDNLAQFI